MVLVMGMQVSGLRESPKMNNQTIVTAIISVVTFILSVGTSAIIVGVKWGKLESDVSNMKTDLAEIKGMFRLTLKE
jgi:cell division protein FtsL